MRAVVLTPGELWTDASPLVTALGGGAIALFGFIKFVPVTFVERTIGHLLDRKLAALKHRHDEQLQAMKHESDSEIESLKNDLSHLSDRGVRSNEHEYEALVSIWGKFMDAFYNTRRCCGGPESVPDFAGMTEEESYTVLNSLEVDATWQAKIVKSHNPEKAYLEMRRLITLNQAGKALAGVRDTLRRQSVFIPLELNNTIEFAIDSLQTVQSERHVSLEMNQPVNGQLCSNLLTQPGETMFTEIRDAVRNRLLRKDAQPSLGRVRLDPTPSPPAPP